MQAASPTRWTVMVRTMCWEAARGFGLCIVAFTVLALLAPWRRIAWYWQLIAHGILFAIYVAA